MKSQYLKILQDGNVSTFQGFEWPLPTQGEDGSWEAGNWVEADGEIKLCENGFHVCTEAQMWKHWAKWGMTVWHVEVEGDKDEDSQKSAFRRARLLEPFTEYPQWWIDTILSLELIKSIPYCKPDGIPKPEWKLFTASTLSAARAAARAAAWAAARDAARAAAWAAARDAARAAARAAAWDAAWAAAWAAARAAARAAAGAAAWAAAGAAAWAAARAAAWDAAWAAAWAAARAAAWDAAWAAAWAAARDARLNTYMALTSNLDVEQKHREHVQARMEVWQKGYCLLCDVDGVLYVYAQEES